MNPPWNVEQISKPARRASEGLTVIECSALACASGSFFEAKPGFEMPSHRRLYFLAVSIANFLPPSPFSESSWN